MSFLSAGRLARPSLRRSVVVVCLAAVTGMLAACAGEPAASSGGSREAPESRDVQVVRAAEDRIVRTIAVTGTLAAEEEVTLSMKVTGRLAKLAVDLGSRVTAGQVLARLVPTDFDLRVSQAEAALQQARARLGLPLEGSDDRVDAEETGIVRSARAVRDESRLTRNRAATFVERGIAAKATLDSAEAALEVAESRYQDALEEVRNRRAVLQQRRTELELARQARRDSLLTAPIDGVVRERHVSAGQYLAAGSPVVTIVRMHPLRLRASVPERDAPLVRVGQLVRLTVEGDPTEHHGRVARVSPAIDETSRTLMVEAEVPNPEHALRPGSFANITIVTATAETAVLVPSSSVVSFAGVDKVLVVRDGRVAEKRVTTGRREAERIEVVTGLDAGEEIILEPGNLVEGAPVRVARGPEADGVQPVSAR